MASFAQSFIQHIIKSLGLKRRLANLFQLLTVLASTTPSLAAFAPILQAIASWLGVAGVGHSLLAKTFKLDIHTVAAFFSALLLAVHNVPELQPYVGVITAISAILSMFASATFLTE